MYMSVSVKLERFNIFRCYVYKHTYYFRIYIITYVALYLLRYLSSSIFYMFVYNFYIPHLKKFQVLLTCIH